MVGGHDRDRAVRVVANGCALAIVVVSSACGRLDFDVVGRDGGSASDAAGLDAAGLDAATMDGATIDGADVSGDSMVVGEGGHTPIVLETRVTSAPGDSSAATLVWAGDGYALAWRDERDGDPEIYFARLDMNGTKIGDDVRVTNALGTSDSPQMVQASGGFAIVFADTPAGFTGVYFVMVDPAGTPLGAPLLLSQSGIPAGTPTLTRTATGFAAAWADSRNGQIEIYFTRIDASGVEVGSEVRVSNGAGESEWLWITWTGTESVVAWDDVRFGEPEIYVARFDGSGAVVGGETRITNAAGISAIPWITWTGSELALTWSEDRDGNDNVYFARLDATGGRVGGDIRVTSDLGSQFMSSIAWNGAGFGVAWADSRDSTNREIYLAPLDETGTVVGADVRVSNAVGGSEWPWLVWTGTEYGVTWADARDGAYEVFFAIVRP